jgi:DNA-binding beta-propeller fold protein YncE
MRIRNNFFVVLLSGIILLVTTAWVLLPKVKQQPSKAATLTGRYLYVAVPGVRDYLGFGGHGLLVFDMDHGHRLVKRIPLKGYHPKNGLPSNVKGIAISVPLNRIYITTLETLQCVDLATEKVVWEKAIEGGCDRLAVAPDGKSLYLPSLEGHTWTVIDCKTGDVIKKMDGFNKSHNTIYSLSGEHVYLADLGNTWVKIADPKTNIVINQVGPFANFIRPFTINGKETRIYVNCNELLGFEVGDIQTGKRIAHIVVEGWDKGPVRRHGCPSHGIGLTPDEKEIWLCDGFNMRLHIFKNAEPYQQLTTIPLQDMPGWITFSLDGKYAYPSSGEVIDVKTRKIITTLHDEFNNNVGSEKLLEVDMANNKAIRAGDQFGLGRVR